MRLLVTGAGGFIGRHLAAHLAAVGHAVDAPRSQELDLCDAAAVSARLRRHAYDVVLHAATWNATRTSTRDLSRVLDANTRMFFNLARESQAFGRLIFFGSGAEFSRPHWRPRMAEDYFGAHVPEDDYGLSKYLMTRHAERAPNVVNLRLFGVFGPHEDWRIRFISSACCRALHDLPIAIRQDVRFDYLHVCDLVRITERMLGADLPQRVYNVCTGGVHLLTELAELVLDAAGKDVPIEVAREGLGNEYSGDNARLLATLGGYEFRDMAESVRELYAWYAARRHEISRDVLLSHA
jgi:UDP-glucose 4-epimerase